MQINALFRHNTYFSIPSTNYAKVFGETWQVNFQLP